MITEIEGPQLPNRQSADSLTILEVMAYHNVPGLSVAVIHDFAIHWAKPWGVADVETDAPATGDIQYQAASASKPVAAMASLKAVENGAFGLDQDINTILTSWRLLDAPFRGGPPLPARLHDDELGAGSDDTGESAQHRAGRVPGPTGVENTDLAPLGSKQAFELCGIGLVRGNAIGCPATPSTGRVARSKRDDVIGRRRQSSCGWACSADRGRSCISGENQDGAEEKLETPHGTLSVPLRQAVKRLAGQELLGDLPLERRAKGTMPCHDFHPPEARTGGQTNSLSLSTATGTFQYGYQTFCQVTGPPPIAARPSSLHSCRAFSDWHQASSRPEVNNRVFGRLGVGVRSQHQACHIAKFVDASLDAAVGPMLTSAQTPPAPAG